MGSNDRGLAGSTVNVREALVPAALSAAVESAARLSNNLVLLEERLSLVLEPLPPHDGGAMTGIAVSSVPLVASIEYHASRLDELSRVVESVLHRLHV